MVKKKRPFMFGWDDDPFESIFQQMEDEMNIVRKRMFGGSEDLENMKGQSYVKGFSITIGPDGKPIVREFGDRPVVEKKGKVSSEREPLVDVIEERDNVRIIIELPGVSKEDIDLKCSEDEVSIKVDAHERKYAKTVKLPCDVKPMTAKANYKNGVLEVTLERSSPGKEEGRGHKVKIQ